MHKNTPARIYQNSKNYLLRALLSIFLPIASFHSQIPNYVPSNGLVGYWPFTGNANDLSGNGYNGTVNGATLTTDRFGVANRAYNYSSLQTNNINFGSLVGNFGSSDFTVSLWFSISSQPGYLISKRYDETCTVNNNWWVLSPNGFEICQGSSGNASVISNNYNYGSNTWNLISIVKNLNQFNLYVNSILINTVTSNVAYNIINSASMLNGMVVAPISGNVAKHDGKIDDIGIWNRALTQQEITALYNASAGTVSALNCGSFTQSGNLFSGQAASNVSVSVPYTGGNGGFYAGQTISSTGVTGLTATRTSGTLANGNGTVSYTITGTPSGAGNATFAISLGGQSCNVVLPVTTLSSQYPANSVFCANGPTAIVDVTNPTTGKTWMDRNLGASQVAISSTDQNAYGDLYQWGRRADGHQCRTSPTTATLSSVDQPAHGNFIVAPNAPNDWRSPQNTNLWQGVNGVNNPCPSGYRVPTEIELDNERLSWISNNSSGAFASQLKWPLTGGRYPSNGSLGQVGILSDSWSSTLDGVYSRYLYFGVSNSFTNGLSRAQGASLRCIKETTGSVGAINCNGTTQSGALYNNQPASNVTASVPYTVGNGGYYPAQNISSTGVTGLTATISQGLFANGAGTLSFTISGTPSALGTATFALNIGGQACSFTLTVQSFATLSINTNDTICNGISTTLTASVANAGTSCVAPGLSGTLTNGLVGYWPFCGNANDLSGNGNNGTVNGATLTTDRFGVANSAYSFDGVDDYINVVDANSLDLINNYTLTGWYNTNNTNQFDQAILGKGRANNGTGYQLLINSPSNLHQFGYNDGVSINGGATTPAVSGNLVGWHFVSGTYDGSLAKIYIDGILNNTVSAIFNLQNSTVPLNIGRETPGLGRFFNGKLDDIGIWNRALTQAEISQLYTTGQATYSWSPGGATTPSITVSPTQTTTYTCTITMNGATTTQTQTITVNPIPTVNAGQDQTVFAGTQVTLSGSGANSYSWNNGISNNTPFAATTTTTYTVTGTTNGCSATDQVLVTVLPAPSIAATNSTLCNGQSTTITATVANAGTSCAAPGLSGTLTNGLVGFWPFCGNANDLSGNGNNGTVNGATLTTDRFGVANSAYSFNGNSRIRIPFTSSFSSTTGTVSAWVNLTALPPLNDNQHLIFGKGWGYPQLVVRNDGKITLSIANATNSFTVISSNNILAVGNWYFITAQYTNSNLRLYINGILDNSINVAAGYYSFCNSEYFIGGFNHLNSCIPNDNVQNINGKIDDIGIWNRALTQQEITQLSNAGQATYSWSPGGATTPSITVSPTQTTTYTCTITMNGATTTQTQTITVNPLPTVSAGQDQTVFAGTQVTLSGSGANSYAWNNGVSNNTPFAATTTTTYTVTGTTNGCSATDQVLVTVLPAPSIGINTNDTICNGTTTTITATVANAGTSCVAPGLSGTLTNGLVGYWPFCGNANDLSGNGNNGTVNGATLTTDRFGVANQAYSFDGVDDNIRVNNNALYSFLLNSSFTSNVWFKIQTLPNGTKFLISQGDGDAQHQNRLWGSYLTQNSVNNWFRGNNEPNQVFNTNSLPQVNAWKMVTMVRDFNSTIKMFLDGQMVDTDVDIAGIASPFTQIRDIYFGALYDAYNAQLTAFLNGQLDDIGIWNRALTQQEITQLYNAGQATYSWSPGGATTPSITVSPTQTTTYTCTITMNGATTTQTQTITVNPVPTVNAGQDQTVFAGTQVTLSGSGANSYSWNNGISNNTPFAATTTTTYTVTGTTNGCSATDQVLVTVLPAPSIGINSNDTLCNGTSTTLTASVANAGTSCAAPGLSGTLTNGLVGYWPFCGNANDLSGNGNHGTVNGATLTTDRFGVANQAYSFDGVNDRIGVSNNPSLNNLSEISLSYWVNVSQLPNSNVDGGFAGCVTKWFGTGNCNSNTDHFGSWITSASTYKGGSRLYPLGINMPTSQSVVSTGNWSFICFVHDANSGGKLFVNGILVSTVPVIGSLCSTTNDLYFGCDNGLGILNRFLNGKLDDIGIWNRALTQQEITQLYNAGQATYSWSPGGATTPSITVTPTQTTTYTCTITMNGASTTQTQTITVNPVPTVSAGANQTVCAGTAVTLSGSGATSYSWNNNVSNGAAFTPASTQTYTVTGTNANGCSNTAQVTVTVNALPTPSISYVGSPILCQGSVLALNATAGSSYLWSNGQTTQSIQATQGGAYTVQVTNANGCVGTSNPVTLTVNPLPAPSITAQGPTTFCQGGSVVLTSTGATSYSWSTNATTQSITVTTSGLYQVTVVDNKGCSGSSAPIQVTVLSPPAATITTIGANALCAGQSTTLSAPAGNTYLWSIGSTTQNITVTTAGTYSVQVTNGAGCSAVSAPVTINVNPVPAATITPNGVTSFCSGGSVVLTASAGSSYLWNNGATTQSITVNNSGSFTVTVTGAGGCNATSAATTVTVNANPSASITPNGPTTFCAGGTLLLSASAGSSYLWSNGASTPSLSVSSSGSYTVTVTNGAGCSVTSSSVNVLVNTLPTVSAGPNQTSCSGTPITLSGSGANSYTWNNGVSNGVAFTPASTQTYTVTGTAANGCTNTAQVTVTVSAVPTVSAGANQAVCQGGPITLNGSGAATYTWNNNVQNGVAFTPLATQTYIVTGTSANGCQGTAQVTVTVNQLPTVGAGVNQAICSGNSVTLNATGASSYAWSNGVQNGIAFTPASTQTYTVTGTAANGCTNTAQVTVTVNATPTVNAGNNQTVCIGTAVTLSGTGAASYTWNNGVNNGVAFTPASTQTYTVTGTAANGCTNTAQVTVTVNTLPTVTAGNNQTVCAGTAVTLSGSGAASYTWNNGVNNGVAFTPATTQTYTVTGTAANGCTNTAQVTVTVNALPSVSAGNNQTVCAGTAVTLSGTGAASYTWNNGVNNGVAFTPASTQTYTVTGTAANGCTNTAQVTVTVNTLPTVTAGNNQTVCAGTAVTLSGSGAASYTWNNGVNNGVAFTPASTQTYTVTGTAANGCTNTAQVTVTLNALPTVSAGSNQTVCAGTAVTLSGSGAASYTWTNGVNNGVAFTPAAPQTYTVTGTAANGCTNTAQVTVTVNALPTANVGNNATIDCANYPNGVTLGSAPQAGNTYSWTPSTGLSATNIANPLANPAATTTFTLTVTQTNTGCTASSQVVISVNNAAPQANAGQSATITCVNNTGGVSLGNTPVAGLTYAWSPSTGLSANNIANPVASPASTTSYTLTVTNPSNGCTGTGAVTVTVNNTLPSVNAGPNQSICSGQSVTLTATGANTYTWNNGAIQGVAFNPTTTQTYTVQGTNSANGCQGTAQVTVTVNALPTVSAGNNQTVCASTAVTLSGSGAASYTWNNGVSNGVAFTPASTQTYTVTGTAANGCTNTAQVTVTVHPLPSVNAGPDQSVCAGTAVTLSGSGANTYTWNNGVSNGVSFTPTTTQTYTVMGTNANGCQNTDQITVTVNVLPTPTLVANGTSPYCPGTIVVLSTTAMAGYTYQWYIGQNIINGAVSATYSAMTAGTYTVKVTAPGGCFATSNSITVSYLNPTIISLGPTSICQGGSVALQTIAGSGYQYSWMKNGMTNINPNIGNVYTATSGGTYKVKIVTPSGCVMYSNSITVTLIQNPSAAITAQGPTSFCNGNTVVLTASNNANAVVYQWRKNGVNITGATSSSYTVTQAGTYTVVIANQACPSTSAVVSNGIYVNVFPTPNPWIGASTLVLTPGATSTLSTITGVSLTYQWFKLWGANWVSITGATQSTYTTNSAGTYRVKVTNMYGCWKYSNGISIASSQMPEPGVSCLSDGIHVKHGEAVSLEGTWYEETTVDRTRIAAEWNEGAQEWVLTGKTEGNFVYVTMEEEAEMQWMRVADGCSERTLVAYPNPTWNVVYLKGLEATEKHYELQDVMGRVVAVGNISPAQNAIDMSNLAPGTYRLVLQGHGVIAIVKE